MSKRLEEIIGYLVYLAVTLSVFFSFQNPVCNILANWLGLLLLTGMYEGSWKKKGLIGTSIYVVNMMCDVVAAYLFSDYVLGESISQIFSVFTTLFVFICQILVEKIMGDWGKAKLRLSDMILVVVPIVSVIMMTLLIVENLNHRVLMVAEGCGILFINMLLFFVYHQRFREYEERMQRERMEEEVRMYQNQLELIQASHEKVRSLRHDMRHHLQMLYVMAEKGQAAKIQLFLEEMMATLENPKQHVARYYRKYYIMKIWNPYRIN